MQVSFNSSWEPRRLGAIRALTACCSSTAFELRAESAGCSSAAIWASVESGGCSSAAIWTETCGCSSTASRAERRDSLVQFICNLSWEPRQLGAVQLQFLEQGMSVIMTSATFYLQYMVTELDKFKSWINFRSLVRTLSPRPVPTPLHLFTLVRGECTYAVALFLCMGSRTTQIQVSHLLYLKHSY